MNMKDRLLYIILVCFTLILISSKQSDIQQTNQEESSIEFSIGDKNIVGTVPEFNFSLKRNEAFSCLKFLFDRNHSATKSVVDNQLLATNFKQYRASTIGVHYYHKKSYLLKLFATNDNKDSYHLS